MALPSNYRWIIVGNLAIRNRKNAPHYAPEFSAVDLFSAIADRIDRNDSRRAYSKDSSRLMWCSDLTEDDCYYRMLLQVGDKNVSGVSFLDFQTLKTRDVDKEEDEGGHYAAHVMVKKTANQHGQHLILIEKVPGIYLSSVKAHFGWVCNSVRYEKEAQDDDGDIKRFKPVYEIDGHQSKTIREALRRGTLQDIEFISHGENHDDGLDEDPIVQEEVHEMRWEVKRRVTEDQARTVFDRIGGALERFRGDRDNAQMFVRIKTSNGQIKRTEIQHNGDEILEQAFVQNELVNEFDPPLTQRYEAMRKDMIEKMTVVANAAGD